MAISVLSVSGLAPAPSSLAAQDIEIAYEDDALWLTYRKGFGASVTLEASIDLVSWMAIQAQDQVITTDTGGETVTSRFDIAGIERAFFRLSVENSWDVTLAWDAPPNSSVSGYRLRYGLSSKNYTKDIDVGYNTQATIFLPDSGPALFFVVTAYNALGAESAPSNEIKIPAR